MIHVGFALNLMSEAEAQESLELLRQLADVEAEIDNQQKAGSSDEVSDRIS